MYVTLVFSRISEQAYSMVELGVCIEVQHVILYYIEIYFIFSFIPCLSPQWGPKVAAIILFSIFSYQPRCEVC